MSIEIFIGGQDRADLLTGEELQKGKIYMSTLSGSQDFLFVKAGDTYSKNNIIAYNIKDRTEIHAGSGHGRDFYLAPSGTEIRIKN